MFKYQYLIGCYSYNTYPQPTLYTWLLSEVLNFFSSLALSSNSRIYISSDCEDNSTFLVFKFATTINRRRSSCRSSRWKLLLVSYHLSIYIYLTHSLTQSLTHSLIHYLTQSHIHSHIHPLTC